MLNTSPGCPCAPESRPLAGCSRSFASCHQEPRWSYTWGCQSDAPQSQNKHPLYLPPSEVTTSLHWHCSSFTTSLNFVCELCTGICNCCVFWICGERCICCCGGVEPRRVLPRLLTGLPPPCLLRPPPPLVWKPGWRGV